MRAARRLRMAATGLVAFAALTMPRIASACPVCFGEASGPMAEGVNNGVLFMLGVVGAVQFGFVALFVGIWRRNKRVREHKETLEILDGGMR